MSSKDIHNYGLVSATEKRPEPIRIQVKELRSDRLRPFSPSLSTASQHSSTISSESQSIDDLTDLLSRTRIDPRQSTKKHSSSTATATHDKNAIDQVIHELLPRDLKTGGHQKLMSSHPCFEFARQYAKKWRISDIAVENHIKLACGYLKLPVILLLNPAPKHELLLFDEMVAKCNTLKWIEAVLHGIGLELADVMILDTCTLLSSDKIKQLEMEGNGLKEQALSEAYDVTQKMLQMIKLNTMVSCQCSTSFSKWGTGGHMIARELSSSMSRAKAREVNIVTVGSHTINVVQAYHPSTFLNHNRKNHHDPLGTLLKDLLRRLYFPCASWKMQHIMALRASDNRSLDTSTSPVAGLKNETTGP